MNCGKVKKESYIYLWLSFFTQKADYTSTVKAQYFDLNPLIFTSSSDG